MATTINKTDLLEVGGKLIPKHSICFVERYCSTGEEGIIIHLVGEHRLVLEGWTLDDFRGIYGGSPF
jgi:hypothetical protein